MAWKSAQKEFECYLTQWGIVLFGPFVIKLTPLHMDIKTAQMEMHIYWVLSFLWVLGIEYIQNIPILVGVVTGLSSLKRGMAWWKCLLTVVGGSIASGILISSTEWVKVMATTRTTNPPSLGEMLFLGIVFSVACGFLVIYFILTSRLKKSSWSDLVFGILVGLAIAVSQSMNLPPTLAALHALSFSATGCGVMLLIRRSVDVAPGWKMLAWIGWLTLLMSILIILFDYVPFLRS